MSNLNVMSNLKVKSLHALLAIVLAFFGTATLAAPASATVAQASCGDVSGFTRVALSSLPSQATDTYRLIQQGGPYPYRQDGTVFQNRERILPTCSLGYYHEYTVKTPGSSTRGARRIVTGDGGEYFYTADHYASFRLITF